jgi:hypothetical protein
VPYGASPKRRIFGVTLGCQRVANFYEKALFVKPTWRLYVVAERNSFVPFALCFHSL